jgi:hypothetical protein
MFNNISLNLINTQFKFKTSNNDGRNGVPQHVCQTKNINFDWVPHRKHGFGKRMCADIWTCNSNSARAHTSYVKRFSPTRFGTPIHTQELPGMLAPEEQAYNDTPTCIHTLKTLLNHLWRKLQGASVAQLKYARPVRITNTRQSAHQ